MIRPQRIVHHIKPGALLKRTGLSGHSPAKAGAADLPQPAAPERQRGEPPRPPSGDADYLSLIRQLPCLSCGMEPSEAAHVRFASAAFGKACGLQKKPDDKWALPLCADCHRLAKTAQHNRGERDFWEALGIDPLPVCVALHAAREDVARMDAIVRVTIASRDRKRVDGS